MRTLITAVLIFASATACHASGSEVAKTIAAEACGEGRKGMLMVANVIANRVKAWGKTPLQVVSQRNQFYGFTASNRDRLYNQCREQADFLASQLMFLTDETDGALYFRQHSEPIYSWHGAETVRYKGHIFHREAKR